VTFDFADCSDGELATLALAGRQLAYGELVRRHRERLYRLVRAHIGDTDEALDVTQATFVAAFGALKRYDPDRPFQAWLSRIAINKCRDWRRRRVVRKFFTFASPLGEAVDLADPTPLPDQAVETAEEFQRVMAAIAALPVSLKEPLILRTLEEKSELETAEILGISPKAVETRLYRARQRLAESLEKLEGRLARLRIP